MQELSCENQNQILSKVKELKDYLKKFMKDQKLITNLQKLVHDCSIKMFG
jgi:hypothetical protein